MPHARVLLLTVPLLLGTVLAQRPTFEHQKRTSMLEYGALSLGQHTIAELPVGGSWKLGGGGSTVWHLTMPAISGGTVVPPGNYIVSLHRTGEVACALLPRGSGTAIGESGDLHVGGAIGKAAKPTKKLVIDWVKDDTKDEKPVSGCQAVKLIATFGEHEWTSSMLFPGHKPVTVTGAKLVVFGLPSRVFERRADIAVPVAVLTKGEDSWNLMVAKDEARFVPWMMAKASMDAPPPLDEKRVTTGTVDGIQPTPPGPREVAEVLTASLTKGEFVMDLAFGDEAVRIRVPEPKVQAGK